MKVCKYPWPGLPNRETTLMRPCRCRAGPGNRSTRSIVGHLLDVSADPRARRIVVNQRSQPVAELATCPMQPAPDRTDGDVQQGRDLLVTSAIEVLEHDNRPVFRA